MNTKTTAGFVVSKSRLSVASQFDGAKAAGEIFPTGQDLYELIRVQSAHYGSLIRTAYGEPYFTRETVAVDDVLTLGVSSL
jgi:hypothetical protein